MKKKKVEAGTYTVDIKYDAESDDDWDELKKKLQTIKGVRVKLVAVDGKPQG